MSFRRMLKGATGRSMSPQQPSDFDDQSKEIKVHPNTNNPDIVWDTIKNKQKYEVVTPVDPSSPKPKDHTRFVCISDTHSLTQLMPDVPDGDVLIHAGDFTRIGKAREVQKFSDFLETLPHPHKIVIAGNHELTFDKQLMTERNSHVFMSFATAFEGLEEPEWKSVRSQLTNCTYLEDSEIQVKGFRIYGSPWQPLFCDWGFNLPRGQPCLDKWNKIPEGIDILVTHGPPLGHGDLVRSGVRAGCVELLSTVQRRVRPKYHVFGHIHEGYGVTTDGRTTYVNASICDIHYRPNNKPIVFDLPTPKVPIVEVESSV